MSVDQAVRNLQDIKRILDDLAIPFWLDGGTLLGAYRDGDFPPDDHTDIDLSTWAEHKSKIPALITAAQAAGFRLYHHWAGDPRAPGMAQEVSFTRAGVKVDVFFYETSRDVIWSCIYKRDRCLPCVVPRELVEAFDAIVFHGMVFQMPARIEAYLEYRYGDWQTPIAANEYTSSDPKLFKALQPDWPFWEHLPPVNVDVIIRAHPKRREHATRLGDALDGRIIWDDTDSEVTTGLRCLEAADPEATHLLILEDDALVSRDLIPAVTQITRVTGDSPISLYTGTGKPYGDRVKAVITEARTRGAHLIRMRPGPLWGVAIVYPAAHLPELADWYRRSPVPQYDARVAAWYAKTRVAPVYTLPSLVDHADIPSLLGGSDGRHAHQFIGIDSSALSIDWMNAAIYDAGSLDRRRAAQAEPVLFRNTRNGSRRTVWAGSAAEAALNALDHWQLEAR